MTDEEKSLRQALRDLEVILTTDDVPQPIVLKAASYVISKVERKDLLND